MDHLRDDQVRDVVVDRRAEEDDALVEEPRVDVEEPLASRRLLDDGRDDQIRRVVHVAPSLPGVQSFVSVCCFSLSGVQIASRASASSRGIRLTSPATRSRALRRRRSSRSASKRPVSRSRSSVSSTSSPSSLSLLAHERLDLLVGDLDVELLGDGVEHELARDRARRLLAKPREQLLRLLARSSRGRCRAGFRAPRLAARARAAARACAPRRAALTRRPSTRRRARRRRRSGTAPPTSSAIWPREARLDLGAQLGERVELARGTRELVVELGQHLLLDLLDGHADRLLRVVRELELDLLRLARVEPDARPAPPRRRRRRGRARRRSRAASRRPARSGRRSPCRPGRPAALRPGRARRPSSAARRAPAARAPPGPRARSRRPRASSSPAAPASSAPGTSR